VSSLIHNLVDQSRVTTLNRFDSQLTFLFLDEENQHESLRAQQVPRLAGQQGVRLHVQPDAADRN
jgi:hypothetical protein